MTFATPLSVSVTVTLNVVVLVPGALGLSLSLSIVSKLAEASVTAGASVSSSIMKVPSINEKTKHEKLHYKEMTVFGNGEFDRSPCGTGTAARMACLYAKREMDIGDILLHESVIGTVFEGRILSPVKVGDYWAVSPKINGNAYVTSISQIILEPEDALKYGFSTRIM